jgi:hypothetical protein
MPNGGSDCCGTCWFNRNNKGEAGHPKTGSAEPAYCEIRGIQIKAAFYTYCANHPKRSPQRDPVPIGPILVDEGRGRERWKPSPDTEIIRRHLLDLVAQIEEAPKVEYPIGSYRDEVVVRQLGEFREQRALSALERIAAFDPAASTGDKNEFMRRTRESLVKTARAVMAKIREPEHGA